MTVVLSLRCPWSLVSLVLCLSVPGPQFESVPGPQSKVFLVLSVPCPLSSVSLVLSVAGLQCPWFSVWVIARGGQHGIQLGRTQSSVSPGLFVILRNHNYWSRRSPTRPQMAAASAPATGEQSFRQRPGIIHWLRPVDCDVVVACCVCNGNISFSVKCLSSVEG